MGLRREIRWFFQGQEAELAAQLLRAYCFERRTNGSLDLWLYSGAWFDRLRDAEHPNEITTGDLSAVRMLSVTIPPHSEIWLLDAGKPEISGMLDEIGADRSLTSLTDNELARESAVSRLWRRLQDLEGVGPVTAGKLMAAKRSSLFPIYDRHIGAALGPQKGQFWTSMRDSLQDCEAEVEAVAARADVALPALRVVDVVVWMRQYGYQYDPNFRELLPPPAP